MINQILDYCECVKDATDKDVAELIDVISMATGWMRSPCETFRTGDRREVIDLPDCLNCPFVFEPYYHPFDKDSFEFNLVTIKGTDETLTPITDFSYHTSDDKFYLNPGVPKCGCNPCVCGCKTEYKLEVKYVAGYDLIPECLLPVLCNALQVIIEKNKCCCEECGCEGESEVKYPTGDVMSAQLENDLGKLFVELYKSQLGMMTLYTPSDIWGVIV